MTSFRDYVNDQQFNPGFLGIFINPFYMVRKELRASMASFAPRLSGRILDVGCGNRPYEKIFSRATGYVGMEYDSPENRLKFKRIDAWYDGKRFPFESDTFDSAILTQVLEHVFNPDEFLSELARVMKRGGTILLSVPFVWDEHAQPYDYARYSSFGLKHLLHGHGFEIIEHVKTAPDIRVIFQLINCYLYKKLSRVRPHRIKVFCYAVLISPSTLLGMILARILPRNDDLYMDNVVLARKIDRP